MKNTFKLTRVQNNLSLFKDKLKHKTVRIWSNQWGAYWRPNRQGYTNNTSEAGVYTFLDALDASAHCGPEKGIVYEIVTDMQTTQRHKGKAKLFLKSF